MCGKGVVTLQAVWEVDVFEGPCITISLPDED
jgi:hypothetical protein